MWGRIRVPRAAAELRRARVPLALAIVLVVVAASVGAVALGPALSGGGGPALQTFEVTFTISGEEQPLASGSLPYGERNVHRVNISDPYLVRVSARLEWQDRGNTPAQDPYVNLYIDYQGDDPELWNADEIPATGGGIFVDVPNPVPANGTVSATSAEAAVAAAVATVNNTTAGVGEWWVSVSAQAPSNLRPFLGGTIDYQIWVTLESYEGEAEVVGQA